LTTLNDPGFFDAARALAKRIVRDRGPDLRERIEYGFRLCVARRPKADELARLVTLYGQQVQRFRWDVSAATAVAKEASGDTDIAEVAAWTMLSNVLLNLDETLTKE
jgi:hypothetical protein